MQCFCNYERLCFNERVQKPGESFEAYLTDLKRIAKRCEFEQLADGLIRDKIIIGIRSLETRKKLMNTYVLTLEKTVMMCKNDELNVARMKEMSLEDKDVHSVMDDKRRNSSRNSTQLRREKFPRQGGYRRDSYQNRSYSHASVPKCTSCGYAHEGRPCPAKGQTCRKCNGRDHFKRCCRSRKPNVTTRKKVHIVDEHDFVVDSIDESNNNDSWIVPLLVQNVMIPMKLDTGIDVNILPLDDFNSLQNTPNLRQTCQLDNKDYLVIVDYHSNYPDVYQIPSQSSKSVITAMKERFGRFGIPDLLFSDNWSVLFEQ